MKTQLRDYQQDGIKLIRAALSGHQHPDIEYRRGHSGKARSVLFALATGAGKTISYSAIADGASSKGKRVLILEHRKELIKQASVALARLGVYHQIVAPPAKINWIRSEHIKEVGRPYVRQDAHVAVASVQTLGRRMAWLAEWAADVLIIDECFPAGTMIDGRAIETLSCGDVVRSFNHSTGLAEQSPSRKRSEAVRHKCAAFFLTTAAQ